MIIIGYLQEKEDMIRITTGFLQFAEFCPNKQKDSESIVSWSAKDFHHAHNVFSLENEAEKDRAIFHNQRGVHMLN